MIYKVVPIIFLSLFFVSHADKSINFRENITQNGSASFLKSNETKGYKDIVIFKDGFIAVGTDGRIDFITKSGEKSPLDSSCKYNLYCTFFNGEILIIAGNNGTILYSSDGKRFYQAESGTEKNINGIIYKNGLIIAGGDNGTILTSKNGKTWNIIPTEIKGNIVSFSTYNSFLIGVTDIGEIIKSVDGISWEIKNFNKEYAGYYSFSKFKKILASQNSMVIMGTYEDGSPSIFLSSMGNVWTERIPIYHDDQGLIFYLNQIPNGITYDPERDQYILACDNGQLFSLPACSKCNKLLKISETDLRAIIYFDNSLFIVGDGFSVFVQKL
jgi:hypothetical protein